MICDPALARDKLKESGLPEAKMQFFEMAFGFNYVFEVLEPEGELGPYLYSEVSWPQDQFITIERLRITRGAGLSDFGIIAALKISTQRQDILECSVYIGEFLDDYHINYGVTLYVKKALINQFRIIHIVEGEKGTHENANNTVVIAESASEKVYDKGFHFKYYQQVA